jgi:hypothetical protein
MGAAGVELPYAVNRISVERAYRSVRIAQQQKRDGVGAMGLRAAKARNPKLLLALQRGSEVLRGMAEEQTGGSGFDVGGIRVQPTEYTLWKNAYETADKGEPAVPYQWIYAAAGILAGVITW